MQGVPNRGRVPIRTRVNLAFALAVGVLLAIAAASYRSVTSLAETGLAIVQKGATRLGGQAGVESEPGVGSRFWVELAAAEGATA
jgi:signal transduction histidine kinase